MTTLNRAGFALCLFYIVVSILLSVASATDSFDIKGSDEHEDLWQSTLDNSSWDVLGPGDYSDLQKEEASTSQMSISEAKEDHSSAEFPSSSTIWFRRPYSRSKRGRVGQFYIDREIGYARVQMKNAKMSLEHWRSLLEVGDSKAMQIKKDFDEKCERDSKYAQLTRKLKKYPNDTHLLSQLQEYKRTEEYYRRQRSVSEKRAPMSKPVRDKLNSLIRKVRLDVQDFDASRPFRTLRTRFDANKEKSLQDSKHEVGDATVQPIIEKLSELRLLLRRSPLDESLWGNHFQEIDEWMQENQVGYVPLVKPGMNVKVVPSIKTAQREDVDASIQEVMPEDDGEAGRWADYPGDDSQDARDYELE